MHIVVSFVNVTWSYIFRIVTDILELVNYNNNSQDMLYGKVV